MCKYFYNKINYSIFNKEKEKLNKNKKKNKICVINYKLIKLIWIYLLQDFLLLPFYPSVYIASIQVPTQEKSPPWPFLEFHDQTQKLAQRIPDIYTNTPLLTPLFFLTA